MNCLLLPLPCGLPYAVQRLGHASPALCPVRALLAPRSPWSPALAPPAPPPVARLCSSASQLLCRSLTSLDRASAATAPRLPAADHTPRGALMADPEISRFPCKELPYMPGSLTTPGRAGTRNSAPVRVAFRLSNGVGTRDQNILSRLNGWPVRSPTDASPTPSRMPAHGSGPMWFATPSSQWTCTTYSLPVSRRTTRCSPEIGGRPDHPESARAIDADGAPPIAGQWRASPAPSTGPARACLRACTTTRCPHLDHYTIYEPNQVIVLKLTGNEWAALATPTADFDMGCPVARAGR